MRKLVSVVFLLMILVSIIGYFPVFKLEQKRVQSSIRNRIKSGIPHRLLYTVNFSSNEEIRWIKEGKEFMLGNRLYDIVRKDPHHPFTFFCINDIQESKLFSHLQQEVNKQTQDPNHPLNKSTKIILELTYLVEDMAIDPEGILLYMNDQKVRLAYLNNYVSIHLSPKSPPPSAEMFM